MWISIIINISRRLLIDTGDGQQSEFFLNLKKSINFDKFALTDIVLTHWHNDHIGGVGTCTASVGGVMKSAEVSARGNYGHNYT